MRIRVAWSHRIFWWTQHKNSVTLIHMQVGFFVFLYFLYLAGYLFVWGSDFMQNILFLLEGSSVDQQESWTESSEHVLLCLGVPGVALGLGVPILNTGAGGRGCTMWLLRNFPTSSKELPQALFILIARQWPSSKIIHRSVLSPPVALRPVSSSPFSVERKEVGHHPHSSGYLILLPLLFIWCSQTSWQESSTTSVAQTYSALAK